MANKTMNFSVVLEIARTLPGVVEGTLHGAPSLKVRGKLLACPALHCSAEPGTMVVKLDRDQRDRLLADEPGTYYLTDHYLNQPVVLVRLSRMNRDSLRDLLGMAWCFMSSKSKTGGSRGRTGRTTK